jgi:monoamine oxidase
MDRCDIAIIGAGVAGMSAAWVLRGQSIKVLESEPVAGGRTHSVQEDENHWFCLGAQYLPDIFQELGREVDVEIFGGKIPPPALFFRGKRIIQRNPIVWFWQMPIAPRARLDFLRLAWRVQRTVSRLNSLSDEKRAQMEDSSLLSWVGNVHPHVVEMIDMWATMAGGKDASELSAHAGLSTLQAVIGQPGAHHGPGGIALARGGTGRVCQAIAERLGPKVVQTGAKVVRIEQSEASVRIAYLVGETECLLEARQAIITVPAPILLQILPELPDDKRAAIEAMTWQRGIALGVRTNETKPAPWDNMYWMRAGGPWVANVFNPGYFLPRKRPKNGSSLSLLSTGQSGENLWPLEDDEIIENVKRQLTEIFPEMTGAIANVVLHRHRYAYAAAGAGLTESRSVLAEPWQRVHFAGDYLTRVSTGEALKSGRAAAEAATTALS